MSKPEEVTVLTKHMVCVGPYAVGNCGCLMAWRDRDYLWASESRVYIAEAAILFRLIGRNVTNDNDKGDPRYTRAKLAQARNRATALLGYVVGNPEAAWARRNLAKYQDILDRHGIQREASPCTP